MEGFLDEHLSPRVGITLISQKQLHPDAVIDTGFSGELFVPEEVALELGLRIAAEHPSLPLLVEARACDSARHRL